MYKETTIGDNKQFIEDILLRIFEKISIISYPVDLQRKQNKTDWDFQYLAIHFACVLFHRKVSELELTQIRNDMIESKWLYRKWTLISDVIKKKDFFNRIKKFTFIIKDSTDVSGRITQLLKAKNISTNLDDTKIIGGKSWILSRFYSSIEVAPSLASDSKRLKLDYIIYLLFFNLLKKHCKEKRGNSTKKIFKSIWESIILDDFPKSQISSNLKKISLLSELFWNASVFVEVANFLYETQWPEKNRVIYKIIDDNKSIFLEEFSLDRIKKIISKEIKLESYKNRKLKCKKH